MKTHFAVTKLKLLKTPTKFMVEITNQQMAKFPERFAAPCTLLDFQFCLDLLFVFSNVIGSFEKKITIICSRVMPFFVTGNSFLSGPV